MAASMLQARQSTVEAVAALGAGALTEQAIATCLRPLFTRTLSAPGIYLASHSLGRPLDAIQADLAEGAGLLQDAGVNAWAEWEQEELRYRASLAGLLGAPRADCVVPRLSAGHALRSVLNMLPAGARVLTTAGEFHSLGMVMQQYAALRRIKLSVFPFRNRPQSLDLPGLVKAIEARSARGNAPALVVVSQVFFATGQVLGSTAELATLALACHRVGARLLLDSYHSLGIVPLNAPATGCDFIVGGCYKYLRGGPGAAFLYLAPQVLASGLRPLDTGFFALEPDAPWHTAGGPRLRPGGDAHLESTPAVLTYYQARSGLAFTEAVGVERLRAYSLRQLTILRQRLTELGIASQGGDEQHGAFLTVEAADATGVVAALAAESIATNARDKRVRLCPDCLTTTDELEATAAALAACRALIVPQKPVHP